MQVSAISANVSNSGIKVANKNETKNTSTTFTSSAETELFNNINEWKFFCHKQITNNIDYVA